MQYNFFNHLAFQIYQVEHLKNLKRVFAFKNLSISGIFHTLMRFCTIPTKRSRLQLILDNDYSNTFKNYFQTKTELIHQIECFTYLLLQLT